MTKSFTTAAKQFDKLAKLRQAVYTCLGKNGRDALFELTDVILLSPKVNSLAELSLSPVFRRR